MRDADVIVIGAGFAGLAAATALRERGLEVLVLEARDRVGGRAEAAFNGLGERVDTGGQFFCEDMPVLTRLAERLGCRRIDPPLEGAFKVQPPASDEAAEEIWEGSAAIRERLVGLADDLDAVPAVSVAEWLAGQGDPQPAKDAFRSQIEGLWCQPLEALPLWYLADNDRRVTNETIELQWYLAETMQGLAERLVAPLGDRLLLGSRVEAVVRDGAIRRVLAAGGEWRARQVIVAVPPATAGRIRFEPPLPFDLAAALSAWKPGSVVKLALRYPSRFWRREGRSGMVMWRDPAGLFVCDQSPAEDQPSLVGFVGGPLAREWGTSGPEAVRHEVLVRLARALGPEAGAPLDVLVRDWTDDPFSGGGYSDTIADFSARDAEAVLRRSTEGVSFACSELSPSFPGYVEGALVIGAMVAEEVAGRLQSAIATSASGS